MTTASPLDFEVVAFFPADYGQAIGGKVFVNGGFWDTVHFAQFPAIIPLVCLVAVVRVPASKYLTEHQFRIGLENQDREPLPMELSGKFRVGANAMMEPGQPTTMPVAAQMANLQLKAPGHYAFTLSLDGAEQSRYTFRAMQVSTPLQLDLRPQQGPEDAG